MQKHTQRTCRSPTYVKEAQNLTYVKKEAQNLTYVKKEAQNLTYVKRGTKTRNQLNCSSALLYHRIFRQLLAALCHNLLSSAVLVEI